jgi:hypothetical protein
MQKTPLVAHLHAYLLISAEPVIIYSGARQSLSPLPPYICSVLGRVHRGKQRER